MAKPVKLHKDDNGNVVMENDLPVFEFDDGTTSALDVVGTFERFAQKEVNFNQERDRHFKENKALKEKLAPFESLELDLDTIKENANIVKNLKDKQLIDEQGVEAIKVKMRESFDEEKNQLKQQFNEQIESFKNEKADLEHIIYDLAVVSQLATDPHFAGEKPKTIYAPDDAAMIFGKNLDVQIDGRSFKIIAKDNEGKPILSKKNHGDPASFSEAIEQLVSERAKTHQIMRSGKQGGPPTYSNTGPGDGNSTGKSSTDKIRAGLKKHYANRG
ncbi:MAG: hypothetical protein DRP09_15990 [Candidatus Thorarchaeota archaeon]|nr:MAG: hypothetical protein DRP09_15990 [Candidatus Thorarchaeota archaeon]